MRQYLRCPFCKRDVVSLTYGAPFLADVILKFYYIDHIGIPLYMDVERAYKQTLKGYSVAV